jgi:hypothetical protein
MPNLSTRFHEQSGESVFKTDSQLAAGIIVTIGCACLLVPWDSIWLFAIGRLLMGFGPAFGLIGVMYL